MGKHKHIVFILLLVGMIVGSLLPTSQTHAELLHEKEGFVTFQELYQLALNDEVRTGVPASLTMAQKIGESGRFFTPIFDYKTGKNSFNLFGMKWHYGTNYVEGWTWEYYAKAWHKLVAKFQAYKSFQDGVDDHTALLQKGSYSVALNKYKQDKDLETYVRTVCSIYATSPTYFDSIWEIMKEVSSEMAQAIDTEVATSWKFCIDNKIYRPFGDVEKYKQDTFTKEEMAEIIKRFYDLIKSGKASA
jgi:flagellum-specific peptidoglycan hydrolase FlgJ